ncbi:endoglucanase [Penicillium cataractarum]|uniref:AA9 family lytic polysaccharide monooxygenase n=1 Tax=Penicillium cataractarum TaxID=2100454 RepID=A0A9W9S1A9_9EURO|nr:endoglucanase [Penicillium cataractarum]KAJ5370216.1 endoglucanase [Penicillium cataractarum]
MPTKFTDTFDNLTPNDDDFRCNLGPFSNAAKTEVADVAAGDTIGMKLFYDGSIAHPGPGQVFMSKAPTGNVTEYQGDGEWFKIWEKTLCDESGDFAHRCLFEFQIPEDTPAGEYLVRAEHVGLHGAQGNHAEFLYSCAQVKVNGSGTGSPSTTYKIRGIYNDNMTLFDGLNLWMDTAKRIEADIAQTPIGDEVWTGGGSGNSSVSSSSVFSSSLATSTSVVPSVTASASSGSSAIASALSVPSPTAYTWDKSTCGCCTGNSAKFRHPL